MTEPTGRQRPTRVALFVTCLGDAFYPQAVSYTHLTLPTIYSV